MAFNQSKNRPTMMIQPAKPFSQKITYNENNLLENVYPPRLSIKGKLGLFLMHILSCYNNHSLLEML